jgi:hypothetical protein
MSQKQSVRVTGVKLLLCRCAAVQSNNGVVSQIQIGRGYCKSGLAKHGASCSGVCTTCSHATPSLTHMPINQGCSRCRGEPVARP